MTTHSIDRNTRFWDKVAKKYAKSQISDMAGFERSIGRIKDHLNADSRVLELGCGTGTLALRLADTGAQITATDLSSQMIAIAKDKAVDAGTQNVEFLVAPADDKRFEGSDFDVVVAFNVLHLVTDLPLVLQRIGNSLKPSGLLISKTPSLKEMNPLIRWVAVPVLQAVGKAPHVDSLSVGDMDKALQAGGFEIIASESHTSKGKDIRPFLVARKV